MLEMRKNQVEWFIFVSFRSLPKHQFSSHPGLYQLSGLVEDGEEVDLVSGGESVGMLSSGIQRLLYFISFLKFSSSN